MSETSNMQKFSRGEPIVIEVERIERELAALWQDASRAQGANKRDEQGEASGEPVAVARAALWNVVVPAHSAESLARIKTMIDEIAPSIPARVIVLFRDPGAPSKEIQATIESNVVSRPSGARVVYSEEITLTGRGGADEHFGALVRALQIPSLPTATFWIDSTIGETLLTHQLLPLSDRLVVDTGRCLDAAEIAAVSRLATLSRAEVGDLGWLRLASYRLLFAGLFDPPVGGGPLLRARRVAIEHRPHNLASALLFGAWLGCQLGWKPAGLASPVGGGEGLRFLFTAADRGPAGDPIELDLRPSPGECGTSGIVAIELHCREDDQQDDGKPSGASPLYAIRRTANDHAEISIPIAPPRSVKLDSRSDAELCVGALGPAGRDPLLRRVLDYAAQLADLVAGRRAR
jgi:hypothetical protein